MKYEEYVTADVVEFQIRSVTVADLKRRAGITASRPDAGKQPAKHPSDAGTSATGGFATKTRPKVQRPQWAYLYCVIILSIFRSGAQARIDAGIDERPL